MAGLVPPREHPRPSASAASTPVFLHPKVECGRSRVAETKHGSDATAKAITLGQARRVRNGLLEVRGSRRGELRCAAS
jgi:hypothetical protein